MDAKTLERVLPLVQALKAKGVEQWNALRIAANCMPAVDLIAQAVTNIELATDTQLSTDEVLALIVQCLKAPDGDNCGARATTTPSANSVFVDKSVTRLAMRIDELGLPIRAERPLRRAGILRVVDLVQKSDEELRGLKGFGRKSLKEVTDRLRLMDLKLGGEMLDDATIAAVRAEIKLRQRSAAR